MDRLSVSLHLSVSVYVPGGGDDGVCALFNLRKEKDSATLKLQSQEVVGNNLNSNFGARCAFSR